MTKPIRIITVVLCLVFPVAAAADVVAIAASFNDSQSVGVGSFNTDGDCSICRSTDGLSNFSFTLDNAAFAVERMTFFRATNSLSGSLAATDQRLVFTPSGNLQAQSKEGGHTVVLHGNYTISGAATDERVVDVAVAAITSIPEPRAWLLLGTVVIGFVAARFMRGRSQRADVLPTYLDHD